MEELQKKISALIWNHFEDKVIDFNFYGDSYEEDKIWDIVEKCTDNICDMLHYTDRDIDDELEVFNKDSAKRKFIINTKLDQMYEDKKDRSLGLV